MSTNHTIALLCRFQLNYDWRCSQKWNT